MFGRMMNNYYYGKSGKGDFRKEDMPENRWQLFWDTLRTRLSSLCRLNLMYMLIWLPAMIVIAVNFMNALNTMYLVQGAQDGTLKEAVEESAGQENAISFTDEEIAMMASQQENLPAYMDSMILRTLLILIPCIAITGPFTAGVSYVTRNWARDEHAFIWSDFKDAVKENWKQGLIVSAITSVLPALIYVGWKFYGQMANTQVFMMVPQLLVLMIGIIWAISVTYMHPMEVTYALKTKALFKNGIMLGIARLPMSVGIRLLHTVPCLIGFVVCYFWNPVYGMLFLLAWYFLIGFGLSRFITASYTNSVFDKYINSKIEGAKINQGLRQDEDEEEEETAEQTEN